VEHEPENTFPQEFNTTAKDFLMTSFNSKFERLGVWRQSAGLLIGLALLAPVGCSDHDRAGASPTLDSTELEMIRKKTKGEMAFREAVIAKLLAKEGMIDESDAMPSGEKPRRRKAR
jgi:hypothetical protein